MEKRRYITFTDAQAKKVWDQICVDVDHNRNSMDFYDAAKKGAVALAGDETLARLFAVQTKEEEKVSEDASATNR